VTSTLIELKDIEKNGRSEGMESINLRDNEALGELADLFHSEKSWYALNGAYQTAIESPLEILKRRAGGIVEHGRPERIYEIMQGRMEEAEDKGL